MTEPVAVPAVQVATIDQGVHLVHPHTLEPIRRRLDGVEQTDRLPDRERDDQVGAGHDVIEDRLSGYGVRPVRHLRSVPADPRVP